MGHKEWTVDRGWGRKLPPAGTTDTPDHATDSSKTGIPTRLTPASLLPLKSVASSFLKSPIEMVAFLPLLFAKKTLHQY